MLTPTTQNAQPGHLRLERRGALLAPSARDQPQVPQAADRARALHHRCSSRGCEFLLCVLPLHAGGRGSPPGCLFADSTRTTPAQVKSLPPNVVATITPHHLALTIDGACSTSLGFCKPLAKFPSDRAALRAAVRDGNPKFFLGSDSAPHPASSKLPALQVAQVQAADGTTVDEVTLPSPCAAGIYTSSNLVPLTAELFERAQIPLERLEGVTIRRTTAGGGEGGKVVDKAFRFKTDKGEDEFVIPFLAGERIGWEIAE